MTSKLTREENVQAVFDLKAGYTLGLADVEILKRVARMALAEMGSEPVADVVPWSHPNEERTCDIRWRRHDVEPGPLYRHSQPSPERDQVRREHAEWSRATFGNVGPIGPLKHLSKEALEAAVEPGDLSEWADMQFLMWDAQRRAGITDEQITQAMIEKLAVNKLRDWPEPKDGEPRLHIKEQPAPVVPDERDKTVHFEDHPLVWSFNEGWNACRAAMLQESQKSAGASNNCRSNENVQAVQGESLCSTKAATTLDSLPKTTESRCSNSPVIPDGYVMVPKEPTADMRIAGIESASAAMSVAGECPAVHCYHAMLAAAPQEEKS